MSVRIDSLAMHGSRLLMSASSHRSELSQVSQRELESSSADHELSCPQAHILELKIPPTESTQEELLWDNYSTVILFQCESIKGVID